MRRKQRGPRGLRVGHVPVHRAMQLVEIVVTILRPKSPLGMHVCVGWDADARQAPKAGGCRGCMLNIGRIDWNIDQCISIIVMQSKVAI